jgi:hypothetical protein
MQAATIAPLASRGLLAVRPDMAKVLTVVALYMASLCSIWFYLDDSMLQAIQPEYLLRF